MKKFLVYYFLFLFFLLAFFSSGVIDSQDGFQYLAVARNIYYKHEPTAPLYEYDKEKNIHMSTYVGKNGKTFSPTGLGYSLAMVPAVAITDVFYKMYKVSPPVHFPLESDWLIFLTASFTNSLFAASLGAIMFYYFLLLGLSKKQSLFMSLITLFTTNLFALSKHSFAHMMFIAFLIPSFLFIKLYSVSKKKLFLIFSGLSYGVVIITYNTTFILTAPSLALYYFLLQKEFKLDWAFLKKALAGSPWFLLGTIPLIILLIWFENFRRHAGIEGSLTGGQTSYVVYQLRHVPVGVLIEGIYGQLFSPGRSIFLYSPLLLIPVFFWHKIKKKIYPEVLVFILLSLIYILFFSIQFSMGRTFKDQGYAALWHGEASWGPRYLSVLIPFGMLIVGYIYQFLSKRARLFVFLPLAIFGIYIELLGVIMPYQIKFHDLDHRFYVNSTEYTVFSYSNLLPRYSPILMMSKNLIKLVRNFPQTINHEQYNVKFYDGIDFPFNVGAERWRAIEGKGDISFDNNVKDPVRKISFSVINHPLKPDSSDSAKLNFILNGKKLKEAPEIVAITQRKQIDLEVNQDVLKEKNNQLVVSVYFDNNDDLKQKNNLVGLLRFSMNGKTVNLESIDVPYVYSFKPASVHYQNWGRVNNNPWKLWDIHTQIFERTPDFWWIKPLFYWDLPKNLFITLFMINVSGIIYFGYLLFKKR